jgi:hypothetical protein
LTRQAAANIYHHQPVYSEIDPSQIMELIDPKTASKFIINGKELDQL